MRVDLNSTLVIFQSKPQSGLLVQRDAKLVQVHRVVRILLAKRSVLLHGLPILLASHVQVSQFVGTELAICSVCRGVRNLRLRLHGNE